MMVVRLWASPAIATAAAQQVAPQTVRHSPMHISHRLQLSQWQDLAVMCNPWDRPKGCQLHVCRIHCPQRQSSVLFRQYALFQPCLHVTPCTLRM